MKLSCIELTEPFEAAVVAVAHIALLAMPKRDLFSFHVAARSERRRRLGRPPGPTSAGLPACSNVTVAISSGTKMTSMAA